MEGKIDDRSVEADSYPDSHSHLTLLTAPTTTTSAIVDMTTYSSAAVTSQYSHDLHPAAHQTHYYPDYAEWQHGSAAVASNSAHGPLYTFAERPELGPVQLYHSFPAAVSHPELYSASSALWEGPPALVEDSAHVGALTPQRYLPGMSRTPAASSTSASPVSSTTTTSSGKPKRRRVQSMTQRKAANIRERRRMFHLNSAFDELRKRLPAFNYEKRLSRIETLRLAMTYIGFMKDVTLGEDPRKIKLRPGTSDTGSDLSHVDMESCTSEDLHDDLDS